MLEWKENEQGDIDALDITTLLGVHGHSTIDVMKIDIQVAEAVPFARNYEMWINRTNTFAIERHADYHKRIFLPAMSGRCFDLSSSGELTIVQRHVL